MSVRTIWIGFVTSCAAATLLARGFSHLSWPIDLLATFALHAAYVFVALGLLSALARQKVAAAVLLTTAAAHFAWSATEAPPRAAEGAETLRVVSFNIRSGWASHSALLSWMASGPADVIVATESKAYFSDKVRASPEIAAQYPHQIFRSNIIKLSRWPLDIVPSDTKRWPALERNYNYRFTAVVRHPRMRFLLVAVLAASPRSGADWARGNRYLLREIDVFKRHFLPLGLPFVVVGDLNASPTGWRSKLVRDEFGLVRSKPPLLLSGTWPSTLPAPLRVPIDTVLIGPGVFVASWQPLEVATGSDHVPLAVDLSVPTPNTTRDPATLRSPQAAAAD